MASYQFKEYNEETETFETFYERLEQFLILEEAGDEKKKAYLLTLMGSKTYGVLKNLCSPILPKNKTFDDLIDILKRHFSPKRSIIVERFIFFKRMQLKEESISDYLVEIKRLASSCNFGNFLEDSLRDKMVCGLYNAKIQNRILSEGDISLAKVIEIALSMEAAEKNTKLFHLEHGEDCVDKLRMERKVESNFQNGKCKHCGKPHKEPCRFKEAICFKCNKKGHIASICWSSRRNLRQHQNQPGNIHQIGDQEEEEEYVQKIISVTIPEYKINFASSDPPYLMELKVEGNFIKFEMDTGSGLTLISEKDFKNSLQHLKLEKASIIVRTYDGTVVPILGKINVKVECQDITYKLRALVVKGEKRALMGREWINRLKLGCFAVKHMPVEITIEEILKENQALFVETTEPIKGFTFSVNMCDVNPIFHKARPVPFAIRPAVTEALDKMVAKGYLCEVASSKWATPVVVVPKKNKEIRICCDFKDTTEIMLPGDKNGQNLGSYFGSTINDLERSGRLRVQRTQAAIKAIRERIRRNPRRKQNILAKQMNLTPRTVSRIINEDLGLRAFKRRTVSVYGEECMSIQMVRRWRSWFLEGWQNVHDDERSGSPVTATDNAAVAVVRNVVEADRRVTIDEIIIRLPPGIEIRRSSIGTIMSDVLDFRKVCARWVVRLLLENHKQQRMEAARVFLEMHQRDGDQLFSRIVTGYESWVHHSTPETKRQSMVWKKPEEGAPKKAKVTISAGKVMAMENFKWEIFTHPPHSPELSPSDFHLYPALKWHLGGKHFANDDEVQAEANHWLLRQDTA
ncbi:K02A2.6-like [Cordylochernes scorpioides]|uniref:K02A2.6-like n=1 Tax=Cordylochernes scorpioides TaxID=51811 RepID=A0ABY6K935_9ARAC|nr:K02A2.6-like [Cordylochernes scorpioides]